MKIVNQKDGGGQSMVENMAKAVNVDWITATCGNKIKEVDELFESEIRCMNDAYLNGRNLGEKRGWTKILKTINTIVKLSCGEDLDFVDAGWIVKYCEMEIDYENERYGMSVRLKNDPYSNGEHQGRIGAYNALIGEVDRLRAIPWEEQGELHGTT